MPTPAPRCGTTGIARTWNAISTTSSPRTWPRAPDVIFLRRWPDGGVSYYDCRVEVHRSDRKHGISDDDIHTVAQQYLIAYTIDDDQPPRELRLGFDTRGRLLEIVVLLLDDGTEFAIHAMKAQRQYLDLLP